MKKVLLLIISYNMYSQVGIGITTPDSNAVLEVFSTNKGILLPRVSLQSTISPLPISSHIQGMIVYNTISNSTGTTAVFPGLYYNDGNNWIRLSPNTVKLGDLKYSFATNDHNGWYLLDGRTVNSLNAIPQSNANFLGYVSNLPNGADLFLKSKTGTETLGSLGGNQSFSLSQDNLPNVNFTGTTDTTGAHSHNVDCYAGDENIGLLSTNALTVYVTESVARDLLTTITRTTDVEGTHTHTVSFNSGGLNTPVQNIPQYIATNIFIYLGK